jgi:peptidyl-tRNA hydrolase, PTH1 family
MHLIIGLGNPGDRYQYTRHNVGFMVVDTLAERLNGGDFRRHCRSRVLETHRRGDRIVLAKPQTFMNGSGRAVVSLLSWYKVPPERLLLIYDDMDLPLGRLRIRCSGSAGTHNGMRSVLQETGCRDLPRLRLGIGQAGSNAVNHVLSPFVAGEIPALQRMLLVAADAVELFVDRGVRVAMNMYNVSAQAEERDPDAENRDGG